MIVQELHSCIPIPKSTVQTKLLQYNTRKDVITTRMSLLSSVISSLKYQSTDKRVHECMDWWCSIVDKCLQGIFKVSPSQNLTVMNRFRHRYDATCNFIENNRPGDIIISEMWLQVSPWLVYYNLVVCGINIGLVWKLLPLYEGVGERAAVGYRIFRNSLLNAIQ